MIFIFACILLLAAFFMLIYFIKSWSQPRVQALVNEIVEEENNWWSRTSSKIVKVSFEYSGEKFEEKKTYLIAQKVNAGESVTISINPKKPSDFKPFYPKFEILALIILFAVGLGLLWFCLLAMEWLS